MRTIVAGSRSITSYKTVAKAIESCGWPVTTVVSGKARGVDSLGIEWARRNNVRVKTFVPDWEAQPRAAGFIRNVEMAKYSHALVALWDGSSRGTKHMVEEATRRGLRVKVVKVRPRRVIDSFSGEFAFLSNFYFAAIRTRPTRSCPKGIEYPTSEHAYQAAKTRDIRKRRALARLPRPNEAKKAGREMVLRDDWDEVKVRIMTSIVRAKFRQHPELADKLLATGNALLVEGNWWHDTFWGVCGGVGHNYLGKILMMVRRELRERKLRRERS